MAKQVWNNLVEEFDLKSGWDPGSRLRCPLEKDGDAFLTTFANSR